MSEREKLLADIREWVERSYDPRVGVEREQVRAIQEVFGIVPGERRFFDLPVRKRKRVAKTFDKRIRGTFHELVAASRLITGRPADREEEAIMAAVYAMSGRYLKRESNWQAAETPDEESRRRIEHMNDLAVAVGTWVVNTPGGLADLLGERRARGEGEGC